MSDHTQKRKDLTFFEAAAIVTGFGIGGGVMAVPYLASLTGWLPFLLVLTVAFFFSLLIHLMIAELSMWDSNSSQLVENLGKYLYRGKGRQVVTWIAFILIVGAFFANLSAYIAGGGEVLRDLLSIPLWGGHILTYLIAAGVVFFGLKVIGISEKYAVMAILLVVLALAIASLRLPFQPRWIGSGDSSASLALYGMIMFSLSALFSVPQVTEGLQWDKTKIPKAIVLGMIMNTAVVLVVTIMATAVSGEVTKVAITGWGKALGNWAFIFGSLFILLAMLTSYWSISFALATILKERLKWGDRLSWLIATLPTLLIVVTGSLDFLDFMRLAGGVIALLVAISVVPALRNIRKYGDIRNPEWRLTFFGNTFFQILVVLAFLAMAVGSTLKID
jgi:amino acid permease